MFKFLFFIFFLIFDIAGVYYNGSMIEMTIPGRGNIKIYNLVMDVNGTIALDGNLLPGVIEKLSRLKDRLDIWLVTANTHASQKKIDMVLGFHSHIIQKENEIEQKKEFIRNLNPESIIAIGQGANDIGMLEMAKIGICVISPEGTYGKTMLAADIITPDILTALELIEYPLRMVATLRQ
jgi:soluble P-type ATPase